MSTEWSYRTVRVDWGSTGRGTRKAPEYAWHASFQGGGLLVGWDEILDWFSRGGWEIFSVVGIEKAQVSGSAAAGVTESFQVFAKKQK
jgi:hypothetical protein